MRIRQRASGRGQWWRRSRGEEGSITIWLVLAGLILILGAGVTIDVNGQVNAQQNAQDVAAQAARAGGQEVQAAPAVEGTGLLINPWAARNAAEHYLAQSGLTGTVIVTGNLITVTVHETYPTKFLSLMFINHLNVTAHATAHLIRTLGGVQR